MHITQILQIADWNIKHTGDSFAASTLVPKQNKFVNIGKTVAHFNKTTNEVLFILIIESESDIICWFSEEKYKERVIAMYDLINSNIHTKNNITWVDQPTVIRLINSQFDRNPDEMIEFDIDNSSLKILDDLAHTAELSRNEYIVKILIDQLEVN